jgi:molybdate transport system substrate-binding protein
MERSMRGFVPRITNGLAAAGLAFAAALAMAGCGGAPRPVLVFAAASLEQAVTEAAAVYTAKTGVGVALNCAGSNVLAQQIEAGAPADLFVSADAHWVDRLIEAGALDPSSRRELLTNRLVVIAHPDAGLSLPSLGLIGGLPFRHLSLADPDSVPAGRYARSLLEHTFTASGTAWDEVATRVAPAPDVRAALALVAAAPEVVGIVYRTDVAGGGAASRVEVLLEIERELDPPIRYVAARSSRSSKLASGASELLDFLGGPEARAIFERHRFIALP